MSAPSSQYTPAYPPNTPFNPEHASFLTNFYRLSDTPTAHSTYALQFSPTATLTMASTSATGASAILALRQAMWKTVKSRSHFPAKVFPFGDGADAREVMIFGTVDYEFLEGEGRAPVRGLEWAARGTLGRDDGGNVVWEAYQVYLDTAAQNK